MDDGTEEGPAAVATKDEQVGSLTSEPEAEKSDSSDDEPDGWKIRDRKGNAERAALLVLQYDIQSIRPDAKGRVPRGAIIPGMDYLDIWAPRGGIPPALRNSKAKKSHQVIQTVQTHIEQSLKYRKQEYQKYNMQQPYSPVSPPSQATNPKGFSHWQMIKNLEEFLVCCKRFN